MKINNIVYSKCYILLIYWNISRVFQNPFFSSFFVCHSIPLATQFYLGVRIVNRVTVHGVGSQLRTFFRSFSFSQQFKKRKKKILGFILVSLAWHKHLCKLAKSLRIYLFGHGNLSRQHRRANYAKIELLNHHKNPRRQGQGYRLPDHLLAYVSDICEF